MATLPPSASTRHDSGECGVAFGALPVRCGSSCSGTTFQNLDPSSTPQCWVRPVHTNSQITPWPYNTQAKNSTRNPSQFYQLSIYRVLIFVGLLVVTVSHIAPATAPEIAPEIAQTIAQKIAPEIAQTIAQKIAPEIAQTIAPEIAPGIPVNFISLAFTGCCFCGSADGDC